MDKIEFLNQMEMMGGWNMDAVEEITESVQEHNLRKVLRHAESMGEDKDTGHLLFLAQGGYFND